MELGLRKRREKQLQSGSRAAPGVHDRHDDSPRPKAAKLSKEQMQRLYARTVKFVEESVLLRDLVGEVRLARGRIYLLLREPEDVMARITPLGPRSMLLETPRGRSWSAHKRGQLATVLKFVERDSSGTFHGLGALVSPQRGGGPSVPQILHGDFKVPVRVVAEPRYWYSMHRKPSIIEASDARDRVLVRFSAYGGAGAFRGTCLYALREGEWGCYTVKPSASESIATAEAWLDERDWEDWG